MITTKLPLVRELCLKYEKIDPITQMIPVRPVVHYMMGGVHTDIHGATPVRGLYAAGEVAGGMHGANRLGGNSLMETITYGRRAGSHAGQDADANRNGALVAEAAVRDADARIRGIFGRSGGERPWQVREELATSRIWRSSSMSSRRSRCRAST